MSTLTGIDEIIGVLEEVASECMDHIGAVTDAEEGIDEKVENLLKMNMDPSPGLMSAKIHCTQIKVDLSQVRHTISETIGALYDAKRGQ